MDSSVLLLLIADIILLLHIALVVFVILGLILIFIGKVRGWQWVRHLWFRLIHMVVVAVVVVESWFGMICPLTTLEISLRTRVDDSAYAGSFISHWLETILYYQAPAWVFTVCYTLFGVLVFISWYWVKPRQLNQSQKQNSA